MSEPLTRRRFLTVHALLAGADVFTAVEVVASVALAHPEWDLDERRTWDEWEASA